jgi:hypothetical protein
MCEKYPIVVIGSCKFYCELVSDFQQGVVECNLGDLPSILVGFRSGNNISRPLAYYSCTFWASPRFGGFLILFVG